MIKQQFIQTFFIVIAAFIFVLLFLTVIEQRYTYLTLPGDDNTTPFVRIDNFTGRTCLANVAKSPGKPLRMIYFCYDEKK